MPEHFRKIVLIVLDGLRPDAVTPELMPVLSNLLQRGWRAEFATTVRPSITIAALSSVATGVSPQQHLITDPGLRTLSRVSGLRPLPRELGLVGVETAVITAPVAGPGKWLTGMLLRLGGAQHLISPSAAPLTMVERAVERVRDREHRELLTVYLNDADLAGHAWGWMSAAYCKAVGTLDRALEPVRWLLDDPDSLVILMADHGGGGVLPQDHDHPHPVNDAIPIMMLGRRVTPGLTARPAHLLDIPATILHCFGATVPESDEGRVLHEAMTPVFAEAL